MTAGNADDEPDTTKMENEYGLCVSTWIKGESLYPAGIR
jgi:hypothetical protein